MRVPVLSIAIMLASLGLTAGVAHKAEAQAPSQGQAARGDTDQGRFYWHWQGGERRPGWTWQEGRHYYPGYRYYAYPHYGTYFNGGGSYYYVPGYFYPRPYDTRP